jgi:lysophospholipase L1-like esterase
MTAKKLQNIATGAEATGVLDPARIPSSADGRLTINALYEQRGLDLPDRDFATGTTLVPLGKDTYYYRTFVAPADMIVTGMAMTSAATVSAGLTLAKFAIYHIGRVVSAVDNTEESYLPIARTANDTTLFNVANTLYQRSWDTTGGWPAAVRLIAGQRYAVGYQISGTTVPYVVSAAAFMRAQINGTTVFPLIGGRFGGLGTLTDIPDYANGGSAVYDGVGAAPWYNLTCDPLGTTPRPLRASLFGDSYFGSYAGFFGFANAQAGSKLLPVQNAGIGGQTTTQMLARVAAVTAVQPQVVVFDGGKNDITTSVSAATIIANLTSILTTLTGAGAKVIIDTSPPTSSMTSPMLAQLVILNAWISALTMTHVYVADTGRVISTGDGVTYDATKTIDGTHPTSAARLLMANVLAPIITTAIAAP